MSVSPASSRERCEFQLLDSLCLGASRRMASNALLSLPVMVELMAVPVPASLVGLPARGDHTTEVSWVFGVEKESSSCEDTPRAASCVEMSVLRTEVNLLQRSRVLFESCKIVRVW
jgi:hypothetical protein